MPTSDSMAETPPMCSKNSTIHDFKVFINSYHSVVSIETPEEKRVHKLLTSTAQQLNMDLEEWTVTDGIQNKHTQKKLKLLNTHNPLDLIGYMMQRRGDVIYLLKDFHLCLKEPVVNKGFPRIITKI